MQYRSGKLRILLLLIPLLFQPVYCHAAAGQPDRLEAVLQRLKIAAENVSTLSSKFVQEKHLAIFAEQLLSQGRFIYRKPDLLRWELLSPVASGFVLRGPEGLRWNGLSKEKDKFRIDQDPMMGMIARQLLAWAQLDSDWLQSRYRIELTSEQPVSFQLFPRDPGEAGFIASLQVNFAADLSYVEMVEMNEQGGDKTLLRFEDVRLNLELPADAFTAPDF